MSRMTALDMVSEVRLSLGGETQETVSDSQILRWINRAYARLASAYDFNELEASTSITTSSGTAEYEASAGDILSIINVVDTTNKLTLKPWGRYLYDSATQGDAASITGTPVLWHVSGTGSSGYRQFTFYPTPAGTYTINVIYKQKPAELVLTPSVTSSVLLEPWDEVLVLLAISGGWRALGDDDRSYKAKASADDAARDAARSSFTSSYVPIRFGSIAGGAVR